jgi:hypothetical protein
MEFGELATKLYDELPKEIILFPTKTTKKLPTIKKFHDFILSEKEYWDECKSDEASKIRAFYHDTLNIFVSAVNNPDENNMRNNLKSAFNRINQNGFPAVYSKSNFGNLIKSKFKIKPITADGICLFLQKHQLGNVAFEYWKSYVEALIISELEGFYQEATESEKQTLFALKEGFITETDNLYEEYKTRKTQIDNSFEQFKNEITTWSTEITTKTEALLKDKENEFKVLENRYNENLMLKEPAAYWEKLHKEYNDKGDFWRVRVVWSTSIFVAILTAILFFLDDLQLMTNGKLNLQGVKETLIFALIVSIAFYIIRLFVTLTMSSYHLSRDAKERLQLTYVYLALLDEDGVDSSERGIILQSIFARSDTGLLKGDSGPTFPIDLSALMKAK